MNKAKKNVVIVGFDESIRRSVSIPSIAEPYYYSQKIHYVNTINEAAIYQGYMLIINNTDNKTPIELDKEYRNTFNKYERVLLYNKVYDWDTYNNKWFKVELIGDSLFNGLSYNFGEDWDEYKLKKDTETIKPIQFNIDKKDRLDTLYKYTQKYKTRKTSEISKDLNMSDRTIERYMKDLNNLYHNIGYDYSLNEWYFS